MSHDLDHIMKMLTGIMRRTFRKPDMKVDAHATSKTLNSLDSFKYVEIIVALDEEYGIELDGPQIDEVGNVGNLARLVKSKKALLF